MRYFLHPAIPRHLPPLSVLLDDLNDPHPLTLADTLGVNVRTVRRWMASDDAPRPVMLALFWCTSWGQSALNCAALNAARLASETARSHAADSAARLREVAHLLALGDFGAANVPLSSYTPATPLAVKPATPLICGGCGLALSGARVDHDSPALKRHEIPHVR